MRTEKKLSFSDSLARLPQKDGSVSSFKPVVAKSRNWKLTAMVSMLPCWQVIHYKALFTCLTFSQLHREYVLKAESPDQELSHVAIDHAKQKQQINGVGSENRHERRMLQAVSYKRCIVERFCWKVLH